jgi:hypothetical protein
MMRLEKLGQESTGHFIRGSMKDAFLNFMLSGQAKLCSQGTRESHRFTAGKFKEVGSDIYYDPKDLAKSEIASRYRECLEYGKRYCPDKLNAGWKAIDGLSA